MTIIYVKLSKGVIAQPPKVTVGDVAKLYCSMEAGAATKKEEQCLCEELKKLCILTLKEDTTSSCVISNMKVLETIHEYRSDLEIRLLGAEEVVVWIERRKQPSRLLVGIRIVAVVLVAFFGSAFSIMTYNTDVSATELFDSIYELVMGEPPAGAGMLQLSYAVGLMIGMLVFFCHGKKARKQNEPTPLHIEMRLYEDDVNTTCITNAERKQEIIDVDS